MGKRKLKEQNLLDLIPVHAVEWEKTRDGTVFLKRPKFRNRLMNKMLMRFGKSTHIKIQLDDFGSYVWERCDGHHRVEQIGKNLRKEFGEKVEPVYERLGAFVKIMAYQKFITYRGLSDPKP